MRIGLDIRDFYQRRMFLDDYELETERLIRAVLRPGDTYVDVGAQLGFTAAQAASRIGATGRMILYEPDTNALPRIQYHIGGADPLAMPQCELIEAACSNFDGEMFFEKSHTLGWSRVLHDPEDIAEGELARVRAVTLDATLAGLPPRSVRLLKMDVEGHEAAALCGLQRTLAAHVVDVIVIEKNQVYLHQGLGGALGLHALLARHGYIGFHESDGKPATLKSLDDNGVVLENMYYTIEPELLRYICDVDALDYFPVIPTMDLEMAALPYLEPEHLLAKSMALICQVKNGHLDAGIAGAEALLAEYPELNVLRGNLAWWYCAKGETPRALLHYRDLLSRDPKNEGARHMIAQLTQEPGGGAPTRHALREYPQMT